MTTTDQAPSPETGADGEEPTRRDFLYIATGAVGAVGLAGVVWPFVDQMNPDAGQLALASIEVDIGSIGVGEAITVMWRGKPIFIRHRTEEEITAAQATPLDELPDPASRNPNNQDGPDSPATDANRAASGREEWLIMVGVCTHLGCVPLGDAGEFDGWFCPCHGSHYDTAGRIRKGPAPTNLDIPPYVFASDSTLVIG